MPVRVSLNQIMIKYHKKMQAVSTYRYKLELALFLNDLFFTFLISSSLYHITGDASKGKAVEITWAHYWTAYNFIFLIVGKICYNSGGENELALYIHSIPISAHSVLLACVAMNQRLIQQCFQYIKYGFNDKNSRDVDEAGPLIVVGAVYYFLQAVLYYYGSKFINAIHCKQSEQNLFYYIGVIWNPNRQIIK